MQESKSKQAHNVETTLIHRQDVESTLFESFVPLGRKSQMLSL